MAQAVWGIPPGKWCFSSIPGWALIFAVITGLPFWFETPIFPYGSLVTTYSFADSMLRTGQRLIVCTDMVLPRIEDGMRTASSSVWRKSVTGCTPTHNSGNFHFIEVSYAKTF